MPCYLELILNCLNIDFDSTFQRQSLKRVNMFTYLGIIFDETISWAPHIQYILSKASKRLGMLSQLWRDLTRHAANTLYLSFIRPIFDYGDTVWNCCGVGRLLDNFQRRASKIVSKSNDSGQASMDLKWPFSKCYYSREETNILLKWLINVFLVIVL